LPVPRKHKNKPASRERRFADRDASDAEVRIIGGEFRGRRLNYHGDRTVRPMKHRTREAIFNLISTECTGRHAVDLFAGTGALGLEAVSRGAASATLIEKHVPTARIVQENIRALGVEVLATLLVTSAFLWAKRDLRDRSSAPADRPWLVFCSPPYAFYHERQAEMLELIGRIQKHAPAESLLVVEADEQFDMNLLPRIGTATETRRWDIRSYAPAVVGLWRG
jgi:16S rRNA (guanine966-N2)-methyltransferase